MSSVVVHACEKCHLITWRPFLLHVNVTLWQMEDWFSLIRGISWKVQSMNVHFDRLDVKNMHKFKIQMWKSSFYPDLNCFSFSLFFFFLQKDASQQVMRCSNVCFLFLLYLMFLISITAGISGVFALCTEACWCNKLLIFHSIWQNIITLSYKGEMANKTSTFL